MKRIQHLSAHVLPNAEQAFRVSPKPCNPVTISFNRVFGFSV